MTISLPPQEQMSFGHDVYDYDVPRKPEKFRSSSRDVEIVTIVS